MKILFKNSTIYDKENRDNFINFHNERYGKRDVLRAMIIGICALYIIIFNIISKNWYSIIIFALIGCMFGVINKQVSQKNKEKNKKQKNKEFTFFFYKRYVKIKFKRQFERMQYFEFKKIFETDENFFLYTDDKHSLILDKEGFTIGNAKEFSEFIKKKCPFKYSNQENK